MEKVEKVVTFFKETFLDGVEFTVVVIPSTVEGHSFDDVVDVAATTDRLTRAYFGQQPPPRGEVKNSHADEFV